MNNLRVIYVILIASVVIASAYGIMYHLKGTQKETISLNNVYVSYAGADPGSTYQYHVFNGSPAGLQVEVHFDSGQNYSSNLSYVYVTTPEFAVQNWTYHFGSYVIHSGDENSTFIGSTGSVWAIPDSASSVLSSTLVINIISTVQDYNGPISIHVVFTGMPVGVVY